MKSKKWARRRERQIIKMAGRKNKKLWNLFKMNLFENGTPDYSCDVCGEDFHTTTPFGDMNICRDCLDEQDDEIRMKREESIDDAEMSWV